MPASFTTLWQSALNKCFINNSSHQARQIIKGKRLGKWLDQNVKSKWKWWSVLNDERIYIKNSENWTFYHKQNHRFYYSDEVDTLPMNYALPISVCPVGASFVIEGRVEDVNILPPSNPLSEFENNYAWSDIQDGFDKATLNPTILLDKFALPEGMFQALSDRIRNGTASIVSDGSYNSTSPIGPVGMLAVTMAPSTDIRDKRPWVKG